MCNWNQKPHNSGSTRLEPVNAAPTVCSYHSKCGAATGIGTWMFSCTFTPGPSTIIQDPQRRDIHSSAELMFKPSVAHSFPDRICSSMKKLTVNWNSQNCHLGVNQPQCSGCCAQHPFVTGTDLAFQGLSVHLFLDKRSLLAGSRAAIKWGSGLRHPLEGTRNLGANPKPGTLTVHPNFSPPLWSREITCPKRKVHGGGQGKLWSAQPVVTGHLTTAAVWTICPQVTDPQRAARKQRAQKQNTFTSSYTCNVRFEVMGAGHRSQEPPRSTAKGPALLWPTCPIPEALLSSTKTTEV